MINKWLFGDYYEEYAMRMLRVLRKETAMYPVDIRKRKAGEGALHFIQAQNNVGEMKHHKEALAMWQVFKAHYPDQVKDEHRPKGPVSQCWKDL